MFDQHQIINSGLHHLFVNNFWFSKISLKIFHSKNFKKMILNFFLIFANFADFGIGLRIDAETGDEFREEVGMQGRNLGRYSSDQRTMKYQKDKEGQLKKVS